jgi:hypothetical protein
MNPEPLEKETAMTAKVLALPAPNVHEFLALAAFAFAFAIVLFA